MDFPIDVTYSTPPALDVLIAACRPHPTSDLGDFPDRESLFYPTNLPLTASLDIASHPILDAVRNTLFPNLPAGHYITSVRDKLEIIVNGGGMAPQPLPNDGRVATILVTLPIRFRGGALTVRNSEGIIENFHARGGKDGDLEWTAIRADCQYEMATLSKGCRMTLSYGVFTRTFGPSGIYPEPLITPSDHFLDKLSPILNLTRGSKIAFYVENDYGVNPADVLAESLVPEVRFLRFLILRLTSPYCLKILVVERRRFSVIPRVEDIQAYPRAPLDSWRIYLARGSYSMHLNSLLAI